MRGSKRGQQVPHAAAALSLSLSLVGPRTSACDSRHDSRANAAAEHNPLPSNNHPTFREYYAMLDHTGRRVDASTRPELSLGSYEFLAPETYANAAATFAAPSSPAPPCVYVVTSCCALRTWRVCVST